MRLATCLKAYKVADCVGHMGDLVFGDVQPPELSHVADMIVPHALDTVAQNLQHCELRQACNLCT